MKRKTYRVLHVNSLFFPQYTGMGILIERMTPVARMLRDDVEHNVLAVFTPEPRPSDEPRSAMRNVFYLLSSDASRRHAQTKLLWWTVRNAWRYDFIHYHTHVDRSFLSYVVARLYGRRIGLAATLDDSVKAILDSYRPLFRPIARWLARNVLNAYVALSPKLNEETKSVVDPQKCHLVPMGIQIPILEQDHRSRARRALEIPDDAIVLIFVGSIDKRKDPGFLVRNLPPLTKRWPNILLLLVGPILDEEYGRSIESFIDARGLKENVRFCGRVEGPWEHYAASDIMVFASHKEGFGAAMIEGMAYEMPIVARLLPGVNDTFISQGESGFLFTGDEDYVAHMTTLLADEGLRGRMGAAARGHVEDNYGMSTVAAQYLKIFGFPTPAPAVTAGALSKGHSESLVISGTQPVRQDLIVAASVRAPVRLPSAMPPTLITMVDAEEEFDWSMPFSRDHTSVLSMGRQHLAHRIFDRYAVKPTYLVDYPVVSQDHGTGPLLELLRDGKCEIGTQLHPWVTPPFEEAVSAANSFLGNLPAKLQHAKIASMVAITEDRLGLRPRVFRAGRYGLGQETSGSLLDFGFQVDSSVMPRWDFAHEGGPNFLELKSNPFWIGKDSAILELPLTCEFVGWMPLRRARVGEFSVGRTGQALQLPGILARTNLLERIKLSPEGVTLEEAKKLTRSMLAEGHRVFVLSYHSPSLDIGKTPYVRTDDDLRRLLDWLDGYYDFFSKEVGGIMSTPLKLLAELTTRKEKSSAS